MTTASSWNLMALRTEHRATDLMADAGNEDVSWMPDPTREWASLPGDSHLANVAIDSQEILHGEEADKWAEAGRRALARRTAEIQE